jgi:hypothetical protein
MALKKNRTMTRGIILDNEIWSLWERLPASISRQPAFAKGYGS